MATNSLVAATIFITRRHFEPRVKYAIHHLPIAGPHTHTHAG